MDLTDLGSPNTVCPTNTINKALYRWSDKLAEVQDYSLLLEEDADNWNVPIWMTVFVCVFARGGMIQTCEQYQFVHHVLSLYEKQLSHTAEE